ncbi:RdgB/HAM1 family non-canonical purine NTP pyrophosphatase [Candidatus Sumerlaeota bacterium]|nr:RdgB/HAM1 family non-canonical purine NTP pyrophosphatase [Candidatus Sumerlaeota bacterium]
MREIVLATHNAHKIGELIALFQTSPFALKSLDDYPPFDPGLEDGSTFEENALIKARKAAGHLSLPCLADDSGLEVDALNGKPGIHSARYASSNPERIERLLEELKNISPEKRSARFVCAMAIVRPDGAALIKTAYCYGYIAENPTGVNGFGYDPVFFIPELGKTMAELPLEAKNLISHRANAARLILPLLTDWID